MKHPNPLLLPALALLCLLCGCEKVSLSGVLLGNTSTDDRVEMSYIYHAENEDYESILHVHPVPESGDYTFLVGADSHMTTDTRRLSQMFDIALRDGDLFCCHLGDIADTKPEYYAILSNLLKEYDRKYAQKKGFLYDDEKGYYYRLLDDGSRDIVSREYEAYLRFPLYVAIGNHDITHNGWAMFQDIFHTSFFHVYVISDDLSCMDRYIFLDSANGTLGNYQVELIERMKDEIALPVRHTFTFTHTNIFRPSFMEFASTYPREELYFLLNKLTEWDVDIAFFGHVHAWDERRFGDVTCLTLDSMSERNSPDPGDYLIRVHVSATAPVRYEKIPLK